MSVRFLPRPNTRFGRGEPMSVYLELYGLRPDSTGRRQYKQWIDVVKLEGGESRVKKYISTFYPVYSISTRETSAG